MENPYLAYAVSYWISALLYLALDRREAWSIGRLLGALIALVLMILVMTSIRFWPGGLFVPGMVITFGLVVALVRWVGPEKGVAAGYLAIRSFVSAEFVASLGWQVSYYGFSHWQIPQTWLGYGGTTLGVYLVVFVLVWLMEKTHVETSRRIPVSRSDLTSVAIIGGIVYLASNMSFLNSETLISGQHPLDIFNIRTLIDLGGIGFLLAYDLQRAELATKTEVGALQNLLGTQYAQYQLSKHNADLIHQKYHDLKHQIAVLRSELDPQRRREQLDQLEQELGDLESPAKTGNPVLDIVLGTKLARCRDQRIQLTAVVDGQLLAGISAVDVSSIFGNALDNAIESVSQLNDIHQRLIHLKVSRHKNFIHVQIENYCPIEPRFEGDLPVTTKGDRHYHGFGLKSIRQTVSRYGGTMAVRVKDSWFELKLLLPWPLEKSV